MKKFAASKVPVIGDSHANFWLGHGSVRNDTPLLTGFRVLHLGGVTAFNLESKLKHLVLKDSFNEAFGDPTTAAIMVSAGEIDCRRHVRLQAIKQR